MITELADRALADYIAATRADPGPSARELGPGRLRVPRDRPRGPELASVTDLDADGVPVRLYRPTPGPLPLVVFAHGGFWTIGDLDSHDRACRRLAERAATAVLAVGYRRAPEHPFPAPLDDVVTAFGWAVDNVEHLGAPAIGGDSCGGHLATLACLRLRDAGLPPPSAQFLLYPNIDLTLSRPSITEKGTGWGLDADAVAWGVENLVPDPERRGSPEVSPCFADLTGLPRGLVVTAEHDPLRDEGEDYARLLREAGTVLHRREAGMVHGFLTLDTVSPAAARAGDRAIDDIASILAEVVAGGLASGPSERRRRWPGTRPAGSGCTTRTPATARPSS